MGVKWTKEQQSVIDLRDRSILVSAAAGSGKTAVLVERIITMLTRKEARITQACFLSRNIFQKAIRDSFAPFTVFLLFVRRPAAPV